MHEQLSRDVGTGRTSGEGGEDWVKTERKQGSQWEKGSDHRLAGERGRRQNYASGPGSTICGDHTYLRLHNAVSQKAVIFILTATRTWNLIN
jgi:hypothetical protein